MDRYAFYLMADGLLEQHGLKEKGWHVTFDNSRRRLGQCRYRRREIGVSKSFIALNSEAEVRDTVLHEIAHALVGPGINHGWRWQQVAASIGARPERCADADQVVMPTGAWVAECAHCKRVSHRHRRPTRRYSCGRCGGSRFNAAYELHWMRR